uniref:Exocyst complex component Sec8 n=1 Tax=Oryza barthii TaxID=65489 RepID=A0A0D3GYV9_9ORYZ
MSRTGGRRRIFDGLPIPADKSYLKEGLSRIDEGWAAARFDSLPHVVHILTSKDREGEIQFLKEQSDLIEDVVDEVVHAYHHGFNKAIQNYSQILRLFSESAESITGLKGEMAEAKKLLGRKNKHLGQLWYRSLTLRHVLSLLDQVEDVAKVPARIENLMAEKQLYAAVQLHVQSMLMLEREGLQAVGALQDVRSDLAKLRGVLFYKILEELHSHLYNNGEYSSVTLSMVDNEELPTSTATGRLVNSMQPLSRRTRSIKGDNHFGASADGIPKTSSVGGSSFDGPDDDSSIDMHESDGGRSRRDSKRISDKGRCFSQCEILENIGAVLIHAWKGCGCRSCDMIRAYSEETSKSNVNKAANENSDVSHSNGRAARYQLLKQKTKNGASLMASQLVVSPISPAMAPTGDAQCAASQLLSAIFECLVDILENHITVGELLEQKSSTEVDNANTPHMANGDASWNPDSESSQATGGFTSECQQLLCEILRATPEAATADAAVQTARLANKDPGWIRRPFFCFSHYGCSNHCAKRRNDGLLAFVNKFLKEHFLPAIFVDYRKCVQQAISSPAAFRPRVHATSVYSPLVENGRPVLQGLLAVDIIAKEVLGWVQLMPNYATELVEYVRTFLERTHERCRASYMEAVLEKQSYILLSRNDVESLMRLDPANLSLQNSFGQLDHSIPDAEAVEVEIELSDLLLDMCPIKQENLIHDDQKLILLASLSDSLEYLADSVERLGESFINSSTMLENKNHIHQGRHTRSTSAIPKSLASLANEYRRLAIDCVRVLRLEMQLETIYHMQEMTKREYVEDQDAEDPDDFIISLTTQIARRDEEMAPYIAESKRNYVFGGISSVAANASIKALAQMKSINLLGVQQICRNSIALEQALAAIPSIDSEAVQQRIDRVRTFYELLNLPFESLLGFIAEHEYLFSAKEYLSVLKVNVPGREMPMDAERRISQILGH